MEQVRMLYRGTLSPAEAEALREALHPNLWPFTAAGHSIEIIEEERNGRAHTTLVDQTAMLAVQTWAPLPTPAAVVVDLSAPLAVTNVEIPGSAISEDSETPEVAAWCTAAGLHASVVGMWVWVDPYQQAGRDKAATDALMAGTGFKWSTRRQSWYHPCTISCKPGNKKRGGKLERFHSVTSAADYNPRNHDPRPHRARKGKR